MTKVAATPAQSFRIMDGERLAQAFSHNAEMAESSVMQWYRATGGLSIDQPLSKQASLAGANSLEAIRRDTTPSRPAAGSAPSTVVSKDVQAFVLRRGACDHLRGENIETGEAIDRLERACRGTDSELVRLRARHASDVAVSAAVAAYDPRLEQSR